jgi:hypothetical protein
LVNELVELGLPCFRVGAAGEWFGARDIHIPLLGRRLRLEVKARGGGFKQIYGWIAGADLLALKADRRPPLAVLPLPLRVELMLAAERGSKASAADDTRLAP